MGNEVTFATHVLSPFLLTRALRPLLEASAPSRVIVVASGGMYTEPLDVDALDPDPAAYDGTKAYARCKRAQVALAEEWTRELLDTGVTVNAMHPGWADTPGLRAALPGFSRVVGPLLRTPEEGADTIVWLAAAPDAADLSGLFFLDRRPRAKHRLRRTRRLDDTREAARLWRLCTELTAPFTRQCRRIGCLTPAPVVMPGNSGSMTSTGDDRGRQSVRRDSFGAAGQAAHALPALLERSEKPAAVLAGGVSRIGGRCGPHAELTPVRPRPLPQRGPRRGGERRAGRRARPLRQGPRARAAPAGPAAGGRRLVPRARQGRSSRRR